MCKYFRNKRILSSSLKHHRQAHEGCFPAVRTQVSPENNKTKQKHKESVTSKSHGSTPVIQQAKLHPENFTRLQPTEPRTFHLYVNARELFLFPSAKADLQWQACSFKPWPAEKLSFIWMQFANPTLLTFWQFPVWVSVDWSHLSVKLLQLILLSPISQGHFQMPQQFSFSVSDGRTRNMGPTRKLHSSFMMTIESNWGDVKAQLVSQKPLANRKCVSSEYWCS